MENKMDDNRNERGQFKPGHSGGPGRGHKREEDIELDGELLDMVEQVVRTGLGSRDLKDRLKAAGIGIRVQGMKKTEDSPVLDPFVENVMLLLSNVTSSYADKIGVSIGSLEVLKLMVDCCPDCEKFGTGEEEWFKVVTDDDGG
jgi:hypothetical protein